MTDKNGNKPKTASEKIGLAVVHLGMQMERSVVGDDGLTGLRVRAPRDSNDDYLIVLNGFDTDGAPVVAFHGATTLEDALVGARNRLRNGTLKWNPDRYATAKGEG